MKTSQLKGEMSAEAYKEYLDDALFVKNLTVTYKMLSFKEKISNVIAQQALEAYMKANSERVNGLYLIKPNDNTFSLKEFSEINSENQQICHIYSIFGKNENNENMCNKTWESDKTHIFTPFLSIKSVNNIEENPLLTCSFSSIEPPPHDEMQLKRRPVYPHDPVSSSAASSMHINKSVSTPSVIKSEKVQSNETVSKNSKINCSNLTKSKTSDLGNLFSKNISKTNNNNNLKKNSTNQLSFSQIPTQLSTKSTTAKSTVSTTVSSHKSKLKRLRKQSENDYDDDENDDNENDDFDEDDDDDDDNFFNGDDDVNNNGNDNGFLDDGDDDETILLPVKHENSVSESKKTVQQTQPSRPAAAAPAAVLKPPPAKKKSAPAKKKSSSGGTQTSIASFFCAKK